MASGRDADQLELQNDQRLDELHSKIRNLRGVTTDIYEDVERQHMTLDETSGTFSSFGASLAKSSKHAARAFGLKGGVKQWRIILYCGGCIFGLWLAYKILSWWTGPGTD